MKPQIYALLVLFLVAGCRRLGPPYEVPHIPAPEAWKTEQEHSSQTAPELDNWWEVFDDETLNNLEEQALASNPSLFAALESVIQARAVAGVRNADLYPQLTLDPRFRYNDTYYNVRFPDNINALIPPTVPLRPNFRIYTDELTIPFDLSYQVDLWGRVRGLYDAAFLNAEAQEDAYYVTLLTLTSDLASAYFRLRTLDAQINLYKATLETRRKSLAINDSRYSKGLANYIDVTNATLQLTNLEATYYDTLRQRALQEDVIAMLIGTSPAEFCLEPLPLKSEPPFIPAGIPSEVLMRRPDIAEAERTMASQHALIGVAYASFFPSFELNGAAGYGVHQLGFFNHNLTSIINWQTLMWNLALSATQTIFDAGRNCSNLAGAKSAFRESVDNYQTQVLTAFREVEDALNNLAWQEKQERSLQLSVDAAKKTADLSKKRYMNGLVTYLEVVNTQQAELEAENNWVLTLGARYLSTVQLIKALGGSWNCL